MQLNIKNIAKFAKNIRFDFDILKILKNNVDFYNRKLFLCYLCNVFQKNVTNVKINGSCVHIRCDM